MTEIPMILPFKKDINAPLVTETPVTLLMQGDAKAQTIRIEMTDKGQPAALDGYEADGYLIREDGYKVTCKGAIEGGVVTVPLNAHCYAVPGAYVAYVRIKSADAETRRTILRIVGRVLDEGNGPLVDTENVVPNLDELLAMIDKMEEARGEVEKWARAEVEAETLAPGSAATAYAEESTEGKITIKYGIPQGIDGVPGAVYTQIPLTLLASGWSEFTTSSGTPYYTQRVYSDSIPDANGDLHLDAANINTSDAREMIDQFAMLWKCEAETGSIVATAIEKPTRDIPVLVGVYTWVG